MSQEFIFVSELWEKVVNSSAQVIDVRAPIEFNAGCIPGSINLPILTDIEREQVGSTYKQLGSDVAIELGHQLVQGSVKENRVKSWIQQIQSTSLPTFITCFRGGMRSGISQTWLKEQKFPLLRLKGGYKLFRQHSLEQLSSLCQKQKLITVTGKTGAGKTKFLESLSQEKVLNLELLANHRGSAFGGKSSPQPSPADYEINLAIQMAQKQNATYLWVEDESRMIGSICQPQAFFDSLRSSPVVYLDEPLEVRVKNTLQEYVIESAHEIDLFKNLRESLYRIKSKLGGSRFSEIELDMFLSEEKFKQHHDLEYSAKWIEKILAWYYDPLYERSLAKRDPLILVQGNSDFIRSQITTL